MDATDLPTPVPEAIADLARGARRVEIFTGAGMSAESGLATFRDAQTGLWSHVDPQAMANFDAWRRDPSAIWPWYLWRARLARTAAPNAGHVAVGRWRRVLADHDAARTGGASSWLHVTTQNIDDLHERGCADAGADQHAAHLHGSLLEFRCDLCAAPAEEPELPEEPVAKLMPPFCGECGLGFVRPGVVWFGESLPADAFEEAESRALAADLMVAVGTSGVVFPAAGIPLAAAARGVPVVELSPEDTDLTPHIAHSWRTTAATGLPALADLAIAELG
ncbi:NAD-dependent protein deacylase [Corynebacterium sp. 335C]